MRLTFTFAKRRITRERNALALFNAAIITSLSKIKELPV